MAEAAFLARQKERSERLTRNRTDKLLQDEAMSHMKAEIAQWKLQLQQTVALVQEDEQDQTKASSSTNNAATNFSLAISSLSEGLKEIKQECASNDLLSVSDTMLLHRQLTDCHSQLSDTMQRHRPKFIFRKYRRAIAAQQERAKDLAGEVQQEAAPPAMVPVPKPAPQRDTTMDRCVACISHADVHVTSSTGNVSIVSRKTEEAGGDCSETRTLPPLHALEIHTLSHCNVTLYGLYHSLILRNITDSTITVIDSATTVHATHCHRVTFSSTQTQQVRLHQSDFVDLRSSGSNIMLEDCQSIVVYSSSNKNDSTQVNDFNWLRADQPSPHYTLVLSSSEASSEQKESNRQSPAAAKATAKTATAALELRVAPDPVPHVQDNNDGGDDTDDDEL